MILIVLLLVAVVGFVCFMGGMLLMLHAMRQKCPAAYERWMAYLETRG